MGRALILLALVGFGVGCGSAFTGQDHSDILGEFDDLLDYDSPPVLVQAVRPAYPEAVRELGAEGEVVLKALILEDGHLGGVEVMESPNPILTTVAVTALRQSLFMPAQKGGEPCCATMLVPFVFDKDEGMRYDRTGLEADRTGAPEEDDYMPREIPEGPQEQMGPSK
jgi:TonB family protein